MAIDMQPVIPKYALMESSGINEVRLPEKWQGHEFGEIAEVFYRDQVEIGLDTPESLVPNWTPQNRHLSSELERLAKKYENDGYFDGTLFTLQTCGIGTVEQFIPAIQNERMSMLGETVWEGRKLKAPLVILALGTCHYFEQVAYVKGDIPNMKAPNALLISGRVITEDNKIILARRKSKYSMGQIGVPGGTYNIEHVAGMFDKRYPWPDDVMRDEVTHELGLEVDDISRICIRAILYDSMLLKHGTRIKRPVLLHDVALNVGSSGIARKFEDDAEAKTEHSELIFVENSHDSIALFMEQHGPEEFHAPADLILGTAFLKTSGKSII